MKYSCDTLFLDINECSTGADACDVNAKCKNNVGSYTCTCKKRFTGNGKTCTGKIELYYCLLLPSACFFKKKHLLSLKRKTSSCLDLRLISITLP